MSASHQGLPVVYLRAGQMHYSATPSLVVTVLGSCLSVSMHCARLGCGGICHGLLPACGGKAGCTTKCPEGFRYVDCSIERMVRLFERAGAERSEIDVKCFGGADMFSRKIEKEGISSVGRQNILSAEKILKREGLRIVKQDVGGLRGRKVYFFTHTGDVLLKRLSRLEKSDIR